MRKVKSQNWEVYCTVMQCSGLVVGLRRKKKSILKTRSCSFFLFTCHQVISTRHSPQLQTIIKFNTLSHINMDNKIVKLNPPVILGTNHNVKNESYLWSWILKWFLFNYRPAKKKHTTHSNMVCHVILKPICMMDVISVHQTTENERINDSTHNKNNKVCVRSTITSNKHFDVFIYVLTTVLLLHYSYISFLCAFSLSFPSNQ